MPEINNNNVVVENVSTYLQKVEEQISELKRVTGDSLVCFRGENRMSGEQGELYRHSMPNIFRPDKFEMLNKFKWFEKGILDEIRSNNLSGSKEYLEIAMDAQHGGFPSRLLDVTFNSLIALFFATTPHYNTAIEKNDDTDGRVLVYVFDKMATSKTKTVIDIYKDLISEKKDNIRLSRLGSHFHFLIDFVDLNSRIRAQQGGFVLFGGNQFVPIPESRVREIIIPNKAKKLIRTELDTYFGINMGMIYPEPENKVDFITKKSIIIENDVNYFSVIRDEIEFNIDNKIACIQYIKENDEKEFKKTIHETAYYMYDLLMSIEHMKECLEGASKEVDANRTMIEEIINLIEQKVVHINNKLYKEIDGNLINDNNIEVKYETK